jgi:glycosyltransferase involved in cell wall biosynthesis
VPNGLNLDHFTKPEKLPRRSPGLADPAGQKQKLRIVFLGRIHPKKGLDMLLPAWARLSRFHTDWELVIAGPDEGGYLAELRELARGLGLGSCLRYLGSVSGAEKVALLHSADLFILPSYSEGFAMSLLEAMACSVPVIATTACNFPEISQKQAGWECEARLFSVMTALEAGLRADAAERQQRGEQGRRLVEANYSWPPIVQSLLEACEAHCP